MESPPKKSPERERVSFLMDSHDKRRSSAIRGSIDASNDAKFISLSKRLCTTTSPRKQPYFKLSNATLDPIQVTFSFEFD